MEQMLIKSRITQAKGKLFLLNEEMAQILLTFSDSLKGSAMDARFKGKVNLEYICEKMLTLSDLQGELRATEEQVKFLQTFQKGNGNEDQLSKV